MRIKKDQYEIALKQALKPELTTRPQVSSAFEASLFAKAEDLLATRRERVASRELTTQQLKQARRRGLIAFRQTSARILEFFAIHPSAPAAATTLATLILAFMSLHTSHEPTVVLSYSDLPALSKTNDAPARYDAQNLADRQAYEREIENAHQKTSGGI